MPKVTLKKDTDIEWNGKVKTLKAGVEYVLPKELANKLKPPASKASKK